MISARLRRRSERKGNKETKIVFHLCSCQGVTAGGSREAQEAKAESVENETVARIRLDTGMWPKLSEQLGGRGQTERDPKGEEDSKRKNRYLGQV